MARIIRLDRKYIGRLARVDFESGHEMDKGRGVTLQECKKELEERFGRGHEIFFGYVDKGILEAYVTLKPFFPGHKHCEVYWLAVSKQYQGEGVGTRLMKYVEHYAKKKGFRRVCLYTNKIMKKARGFYESLGYRLVNEFPGYYGFKKDNTAVLYAKEL